MKKNDKPNNTFTNTEGREIECRPVAQHDIELVRAQIRQEYINRGEPIETPTYTAEIAGGGTQTFPHEHDPDHPESSTLQTDEDREKWAEYQKAITALQREEEQRLTEILLLEGVVVNDDELADPKWLARRKRYGLPIPEDPDDLRMEYIQSRLLKTPQDIVDAVMTISKLSAQGVNPAVLAAVEASFRGALESYTPGGSADSIKRVGTQPLFHGNAGGAELADSSE